MKIVGSYFTGPLTKLVIEKLTANYGLQAPVQEYTGTAKGIEVFCDGVGLDKPDIVAVSRRMRIGEFQACVKNGVKEIVEIQVGYDALVMVSRKDDADYSMNLETLYRGVAAELPDGDLFVPNALKTWDQIDRRLPKADIHMLLADRSSSARSIFNDRFLQGACRDIQDYKGIFSAEERVNQCIGVRKDGHVTEFKAPYETQMLERMNGSPNGTLAIMPYRFASAHLDKLKLSAIDGVMPSVETIGNHQYEFVRPLYYYVKKAHMKNSSGKGLVTGIREFISEVTRESTMGPEGYLTSVGLVPMSQQQREEVRDDSLSLTLFSR